MSRSQFQFVGCGYPPFSGEGAFLPNWPKEKGPFSFIDVRSLLLLAQLYFFSSFFLSFFVGTKSAACQAAKNIMRKINKHVSRKSVWRMCDQGPLGRKGAPLMLSRVFAVALS